MVCGYRNAENVSDVDVQELNVNEIQLKCVFNNKALKKQMFPPVS